MAAAEEAEAERARVAAVTRLELGLPPSATETQVMLACVRLAELKKMSAKALKKQAAALGVDAAHVAAAAAGEITAGEITALIALVLRTEAEPLWIAERAEAVQISV